MVNGIYKYTAAKGNCGWFEEWKDNKCINITPWKEVGNENSNPSA